MTAPAPLAAHEVNDRTVIHEISSSTQEMPELARSGSDLPKASRASIRRKTLDLNQLVARRQILRKEYAAIFAEAMIRYPQRETAKATAAQHDRGRELLELFLETSAG